MVCFFVFFLPCTCLYMVCNWKCRQLEWCVHVQSHRLETNTSLIRCQLVNAMLLCNQLSCVGSSPPAWSATANTFLACEKCSNWQFINMIKDNYPKQDLQLKNITWMLLSQPLCVIVIYFAVCLLCRFHPLTLPLSRSPSCSCLGTVRPR